MFLERGGPSRRTPAPFPFRRLGGLANPPARRPQCRPGTLDVSPQGCSGVVIWDSPREVVVVLFQTGQPTVSLYGLYWSMPMLQIYFDAKEICTLGFSQLDNILRYKRDGTTCVRDDGTDPDWAPSLHLGHTETIQTDTECFARQNKRRKRKKQPAQLKDMGNGEQHTEETHKGNGEQQTEETHKDNGEQHTEETHKDNGEEQTEETHEDNGEQHTEETHEDNGEQHTEETHKDNGEQHTEETHEDNGEQHTEETHEDNGKQHTEEMPHTTQEVEATQTECNMCVQRCAESTFGEKLQRELNEYRMSDGFFGDNDDKVKYYTAFYCVDGYGTVPINMILPREGEDVTFLDKIVTVCCALTNQCPTVV
ncbi:hypothetical protein QQF64_018337 [Cirrhinus molitorella]|uniref:Uncharacterized protein n=1 Tax=Cirrhinus molitorella TaxID=172907 RepID=A0ABR3LEV3_9TELE